MMFSVANIFVLVCVVGLAKAADECPCTLVNSTTYPSTYKWDCYALGLTSVPGQCYDIQSADVTEYDLGSNQISGVSTIDFVGLWDLKSLLIDTNQVEYFDPTALDGVNTLEIFHAGANENMEFPLLTLRNQPELREINFVGSKILNIPTITSSTKLEKLDARSCDLLTLSRPTFGELTSTTFSLNLIGNSITDVAADILLPLPEGATINVDSYFTIWAMDDTERDEVLAKNWNINLDLEVSLKVCGTNGDPTDATMC